jgi:hypothetical protein
LREIAAGLVQADYPETEPESDTTAE